MIEADDEEKVRAPSEKMPGNNRAKTGSCSFFCIAPLFDRQCNRNRTARRKTGKGEKAV